MKLEDRDTLADIYYDLGVDAYNSGHYDEACGHFEAGIKYGEGSTKLAELYMYNAKANSKEMMHAEALKKANKAVAIAANNPEVYMVRGEVLARSCVYDLANEDFLKARDMKPKDRPILGR